MYIKQYIQFYKPVSNIVSKAAWIASQSLLLNSQTSPVNIARSFNL